VNVINWSERVSPFTFPKHMPNGNPQSVMYITDTVP
jgi:hypothetical protein